MPRLSLNVKNAQTTALRPVPAEATYGAAQFHKRGTLSAMVLEVVGRVCRDGPMGAIHPAVEITAAEDGHIFSGIALGGLVEWGVRVVTGENGANDEYIDLFLNEA